MGPRPGPKLRVSEPPSLSLPCACKANLHAHFLNFQMTISLLCSNAPVMGSGLLSVGMIFPWLFLKLFLKKGCIRQLVGPRQWHPTPVLLPGKSHGWRSLVGCGPWGHEESDMTERLHFHFSLSHIGGGNGNPLQCSCLENLRDRGTWWAAVYGVAQSRTQLK